MYILHFLPLSLVSHCLRHSILILYGQSKSTTSLLLLSNTITFTLHTVPNTYTTFYSPLSSSTKRTLSPPNKIVFNIHLTLFPHISTPTSPTFDLIYFITPFIYKLSSQVDFTHPCLTPFCILHHSLVSLLT